MSKLLDLAKAAVAEIPVFQNLSRWVLAASRDIDASSEQSSETTETVDGSGISITGGFEYFANPPVLVNSTTGNDGADGITEPLASISELGRRYSSRTLLPTQTSLNIELEGSFPTQKLILNFASPGATQITVSGQTTQLYAGSLTAAYTPFNAGANQRAAFTDAAANYPTLIRQRIRMTSGLRVGAVTWLCPSAGSGPTNGLVGQLTLLTATGVSTSGDPANGDQYVIESLPTQMLGYDIAIQGNAFFTLRDLDFFAAAATVVRSRMVVGGQATQGRTFGCQYSGAGSHQIGFGNQDIAACAFKDGISSLTGGLGRQFDCCMFGGLQQFTNGAQFGGQGNVHDGVSANPSILAVSNGAILEDITQRGIFGCTATDALVLVDDGGFFQSTLATANLWGGVAPNALNVGAFALRVRTQSSYEFITLPTLIATTPGTDVVYGGTTSNWAGVAAGVINANNGACIAPKA